MTAIAGCIGGSGSSGFDIAEGLAIQRVVERSTCEMFDDLTICPADTSPGSLETPSVVPTAAASPAASPAPSEPSLPTTTDVAMPARTETPPGPAGATPTSSPPPTADAFATPTADITGSPAAPSSPTPTATTVPSSSRPPSASETPKSTDSPTPTMVPGMKIVTNRANFDDAPLCVAGDTPAPCVVDFEFRALGFAGDVAFRVASRPLDAAAQWLVLDPVTTGLAGPLAVFIAPIPIDLSPTPESPIERLQIVVLGFESDPGPVPRHVDRLSQTGADLAFAVEPISILIE